MKFLSSFCMIFCLIALFSCTNSNVAESGSEINYSLSTNWLSLPNNDTKKEVDVFYVYPTSWFKEDPSEPNICAIDNKIMLIGSQDAFDRQASAFETVGNIYAPYYQQADAAYILSLPEEERWDFANTTPGEDVSAAFHYFIQHYNNNKPFILLGHSQGAMMLQILLKDYMIKHPDVYKRMISAYVIGYPVTAKFMAENKHLRFAESADDTGVIISYNTQSPLIGAGENVLVTDNTSLVINPINWKRDETYAPASENLGSYMPEDATFTSEYGIIENLADARIDLSQGVVVCSSVDAQEMHMLSRGTFALEIGRASCRERV